MCLAVPGRVVEIAGSDELRTARVEFGGVVRPACLAYVPEAQVGDYVLVHVGFAISRIDEDTARETYAILAEIGALELPEEESDAPH
ncbi:MAG TPA: HypC/HybG/HupF family hydrogenase formation chaperone [Candidatus Baltobacteraceae bacterium]|nr:HypC/HybG/HupF family hydrogenase formation chaperone [Candidatus Baltobacteraceae bacterium]